MKYRTQSWIHIYWSTRASGEIKDRQADQRNEGSGEERQADTLTVPRTARSKNNRRNLSGGDDDECQRTVAPADLGMDCLKTLDHRNGVGQGLTCRGQAEGQTSINKH